jgi:hypothetical protein
MQATGRSGSGSHGRGPSGRSRRWRGPSPSLIVALIALFAALGGTATALQGVNSVRSDDIARKAVKARHIAPKQVKNGHLQARAVSTSKIRPGAVKPAQTNLALLRSFAGESSTTSTTAVDLGGPSVTVDVPKGALVAIYAEVEMRSTGGAANNAQVFIHEPTLFPTPARILSGSHGQFRVRRTAPGPDAEGVTNRARGGWLVFASNPGQKTFSLRYRTTGGTSIFKNRKLWVSVIS